MADISHRGRGPEGSIQAADYDEYSSSHGSDTYCHCGLAAAAGIGIG